MRPAALAVLAVLAVSAVLPAPALAQTPDVPRGIAAALDSANAEFSRAYVRADGVALAGFYDAEAVIHPPAGGVLVDGAMKSFWNGGNAARRFGHRLEATYRRVLAPDVVLEMGRWNSRGGDSEATAEWAWGCYTVIWMRGDDGRWRLTYDGWTVPMTEDWACKPRGE